MSTSPYSQVFKDNICYKLC